MKQIMYCIGFFFMINIKLMIALFASDQPFEQAWNTHIVLDPATWISPDTHYLINMCVYYVAASVIGTAFEIVVEDFKGNR